MLATAHCLALVPVHSSKPKRFGTRSPISINCADSIFTTRLDGTGGIVDPAGEAGAMRWVVEGATLFFW